MAVDGERLMNLFESYWFRHGLFSAPPPSEPQVSREDQDSEAKPELARVPTFHNRSLSDQIPSLTQDFFTDSPSSVLHSPKLQTILSGKDVGEFSEPVVRTEEIQKAPTRRRFKEKERRRKRGIHSTKSLSDLEFEELKGFMDLGFVFSEETIDSNLVSILPGLQRLGRKSGKDGVDEREEKEEKGEEKEENPDSVARPVVSRPYLSEAWALLEKKRKEKEKEKEKPLMNWEIPSVGNEVVMKDHLRVWAHRVASTVR